VGQNIFEVTLRFPPEFLVSGFIVVGEESFFDESYQDVFVVINASVAVSLNLSCDEILELVNYFVFALLIINLMLLLF
jgi:hypothetical protein